MFKHRLHDWRIAGWIGLGVVVVVVLGLFLGTSNLVNAKKALVPQFQSGGDKKGIQAGDLRPGSVDRDQRINKMAESGAVWIRIDLQSPTAPGTPSTAQDFDNAYRPIIQNLKAQNQNIRIIGLLSYDIWPTVPGCNSRDCRNDNAVEFGGSNGYNDYVGAFAQKSGEIAAALGDLVDYWEIWNEPDAYNPGGNCNDNGTLQSNPQQSNLCPSVFAQLMDKTSLSVHNNDLGSTVISGGVTDINIPYLQQTYAMGVSPTVNLRWDLNGIPFNGIGIHVYTPNPSVSTLSNTYIGTMVPSTYGTRDIYITEIGWYTPTPGSPLTAPRDEDTQASIVTEAYDAVNRISRVRAAIWFYLKDQDPAFPPGNFGLLRNDWTPKPAWCTFTGRPLEDCPPVQITSRNLGSGIQLTFSYGTAPINSYLSIERGISATVALVRPPGLASLSAVNVVAWDELTGTLDISGTTDITYTDQQVQSNTEYCYRARIQVGNNYSPYSNEVCVGATIRYPNFEIASGLQLVGSAQVYTPSLASHPVLRLTQPTASQSGAIWYHKPLTISEHFETVFDFRLSQPDPGVLGGADGFAFVIHNDPRGSSASGNGGCGIGYQTIENGLAIEFDTFKNPPYCEDITDPSSSHVGVLTGDTQGQLSPRHGDSRRYTNTIELADGNVHTAKISYDAGHDGQLGQLKIYLDQIDIQDTPILTVDIDLSETLGLSGGTAWIGFTAGTGTSFEAHDILNWYVAYDWDPTPTPTPPPTLGCKVAKGASQALGNGQTTAITFDTQINDTTPNDDCWTPAQPGRLYAREAGYYLAGGALTLKSAARSGKLVVIVRRGGGNWIQAHGTHLHTVDDTIYSVMTGMFYLNVGEYIEIVGYHTLGDGIKTYQAAGCEHCVNGWLMKIGD